MIAKLKKSTRPIDTHTEVPPSPEEESSQTVVAILEKYGQAVLYGILISAGLLILVYQYSASNRRQAEQDYLTADQYYMDLRREGTEDLAPLDEVIARRDELNTKYQAVIAQELIASGEGVRAEEYARPALDRVDASNPYRAYGESTLKIENGDYANALTAASELNISKDEQPILAAMTLLRIALLQQESGNQSAEAEAWRALGATNGAKYLKHLSTAGTSVGDYAKHRISELSK
jgi:hypothetical protein